MRRLLLAGTCAATLLAPGARGQRLMSAQDVITSLGYTPLPQNGSAASLYVAVPGGSTSRLLPNKLADQMSVVDLGADPTGATDSTAAFNAMSGSKRIWDVPPGRYAIDGCLQLDQTGMRGHTTYQREAIGEPSLSSGSVLMFEPSSATCPAQIQTVRGGLDIEGLTFFWPAQNGSQAAVTVTVNGAGAAAGATTIPVANASALLPDSYVYGSGLPSMERLLTVNTVAGTVTLETPTTAAIAAGSTFSAWSPPVYPPLLGTVPAGGLVDLTFERNVVLNAYDFVGLSAAAGGSGDWRITDNRIFAAHHAFDLLGTVPETTIISGNLFTVGIYGSVALTGQGALGRWSNLNSEWIHVDPGANNAVTGITATGNLIHGYRYGERVLSGVLNLFTGVNNTYDGVGTLLSVEGAGGYVGAQYGGVQTIGMFDPVAGTIQPQFQLPGLSFTQSGPVRAYITDMDLGYSGGDEVDVLGTGASVVSIRGGTLEDYGTGGGTDAWGVSCTNPAADLTISTTFKGTGSGNQDGVSLSGCGSAAILGNVFDGIKTPVLAFSGGRAVIAGNTSSATTGGSAYLQYPANFTLLKAASNSWDVSGSTHVGWPLVAAAASVSQTVSGSAKTRVMFGNDSIDDMGSFATNTLTAPVAGYYEISTTVAQNGTGNAGDVWSLTVDQAGSAALSYARDYIMPAAIGAIDITQILYLSKGDTVTANLQRMSGSGSWNVPADGTRTRFNAYLIQ